LPETLALFNYVIIAGSVISIASNNFLVKVKIYYKGTDINVWTYTKVVFISVLKEENLGDLGVDGTIILKWDSKQTACEVVDLIYLLLKKNP
jgi:hypothetical protein